MKVDFAKLDRAFNPKVVVVVGDKNTSNFMWLRGQSTVKGKLYSVQISPDQFEPLKALGIPNFTSLLDIPEPVDLVIVAVPRVAAPAVLEDCIRKDVAAAHFFTAGFTETETEEGRKLEQRLIERAKQANFHLIGPNCMGIFNPEAGVRQMGEQYTGSAGPVGFISQSGTHAISFALDAHLMGVDINKSVSFGNGVVLDSADFLEYFAQDPKIKVIGMYIEGVKDGRRFFNVLREAAARKPVVIWKGGRTGEGERAIASHTASLAVSQTVWQAALRQCGALSVNRLEEMVDTLKALLYLPPVRGDRVAVTGGSGGQSVAIADVLAEAGLTLPLLSDDSYAELATFFTLIGGGYRNPVDTGNANRREMKRILEILARDTNTDNLVLLTSGRFRGPAAQFDSELEMLANIRRSTKKPMLAILAYAFAPQEVEQVRDMMQKLQAVGIPAFPGFERGALALRKALDYCRSRNGSID